MGIALSTGLGPEHYTRLLHATFRLSVADAQLALSVYLRASASPKVIQCFMETGQFDKIMVYCQKVSYTPDWGILLTHIVRANPAAALEFAQKLAGAPDVTLDLGVVTDVFMSHNSIHPCLVQRSPSSR